MPRVQDALPSLDCRAWKGRSNPLLLNPLRFAQESRRSRAACFTHTSPRGGWAAVFGRATRRLTFAPRPTPSSSLAPRLRISHTLVLGRYSVHTSIAALAAAERSIEEIRMRLRKEGARRPNRADQK